MFAVFIILHMEVELHRREYRFVQMDIDMSHYGLCSVHMALSYPSLICAEVYFSYFEFKCFSDMYLFQVSQWQSSVLCLNIWIPYNKLSYNNTVTHKAKVVSKDRFIFLQVCNRAFHHPSCEAICSHKNKHQG